MKTTTWHRVVWVTVPDRVTGRRLARAILEARLAGCVSLVPGIESHYWWRGKLETGRELLLMIKTREEWLPALESLVHGLHPYETPEFLVLPILAGSARYLGWIDEEVTGPAVDP